MAFHEAGAAAALAGVQLVAVGTGRDGTFTGAEVTAAVKGETRLGPPTRLVCVENTHNRGGGSVWTAQDLESVARSARDHGLALHLDGARLLNAAVASGRGAAELATPFDTVTFAFSKGLGAPVGSVIAGRWPDIERAARLRKMLGGGMRQAGILAAAALWALDHNVERIAADHANARFLAERLASIPGIAIDLTRVQTNIVMADLSAELPSAAEVVAALTTRGVHTLAFGPRRLRLVTHLDVDRAACERAADCIAEVARRRS
jgi:threonine aldolase